VVLDISKDGGASVLMGKQSLLHFFTFEEESNTILKTSSSNHPTLHCHIPEALSTAPPYLVIMLLYREYTHVPATHCFVYKLEDVKCAFNMVHNI
jgi:hypothetical protein